MLKHTLHVLISGFACVFSMVTVAGPAVAQTIEVPAYTAYIEPDWSAARVSERGGITRWNDPTQAVQWYGKFAKGGPVQAKVTLRVDASVTMPMRLTIDGQTNEAKVSSAKGAKTDTKPSDGNKQQTGEPSASNKSQIEVDFGSFTIKTLGYLPIRLEAIAKAGEKLPDVLALKLDGAAVDGAHFNLKSRRNAASVHLMYPVPKETKVSAFACEVTAVTDPTMSFYMACGWHRGYFGMQVNSPTERRIIFSVWDSGNEAVSRDKVAAENRVQLVSKGPGVYSGDFGNEGTGGHSHLKTMWKTGSVQRFVATAEPVDETHTIFSGYWFHPDDQKWMLISSWKAPKEGGWMRGLHSFSENFGGENGHLTRKALYGNQWIRTDAGEWRELTEAKFSHDPTGREDRFDRFMGVESNQFFLSHGGFSNGFTKYGEAFQRPALGLKPEFKP